MHVTSAFSRSNIPRADSTYPMQPFCSLEGEMGSNKEQTIACKGEDEG
jgi:hypothetical protein